MRNSQDCRDHPQFLEVLSSQLATASLILGNPFLQGEIQGTTFNPIVTLRVGEHRSQEPGRVTGLIHDNRAQSTHSERLRELARTDRIMADHFKASEFLMLHGLHQLYTVLTQEIPHYAGEHYTIEFLRTAART